MIVMVVKDCKYNPIVDLNPVSQTGFVDLQKAMVNNCIPSNIVASEQDYNGIDDPASILGKPSDIFEAMDMEGYVKEAGTKSESDSASS